MLDEHITITSSDGAKLHAVLNRSLSDRTLVIFVHGLTADWHRTVPHVLSRYLVSQDISCARLSLYPGGEGRNLLDTSITVHSQDVDSWVDRFVEEYEHVILVGHSLGSPAIYKSKSLGGVSGVVYLEPSIGTRKTTDLFEFLPEIGLYASQGGAKSLYSKELVEEWCDLDGREVLEAKNSSVVYFWWEYVSKR